MKKEIERINKAYFNRYNKSVRITDIFGAIGMPREYYSQFDNMSKNIQNRIVNELKKLTAEDIVRFRIMRQYGFIPSKKSIDL